VVPAPGVSPATFSGHLPTVMSTRIAAWLLVAELIAGCTSSHRSAPSNSATRSSAGAQLVGVTWRLEYVQADAGRSLRPAGRVPMLSFLSETSFSGSTTCNGVEGSNAAFTSSHLSFGRYVSTTANCPDPVDRLLTTLFHSGGNWHIDGHGMVVQIADGTSFHFSKK
jgi:heat shock protein HslJ